MRATKRNVLVLLGVLTIAGGALFGTGAFSQVEAQRSVNVDTAGDASAQLGLAVSGDLQGSDADTIAFELGGGNGVNLDAVTRFNGTLTVTNNGGNQVTLDVQDSAGNSIVGGTSVNSDMYFVPQGGSNDIAASGSVTYDVVFDTTGTTTQGNANIPSDVTIVAQE